MAIKKKLYTLTEEHRSQLAPWASRWIANALNCEPMTDGDRDAMRTAVNGLHAAANLKPPRNIAFTASPMSAAIAAGVAAGVWWLRKHPEEHVKLFGCAMTEPSLMAAIGPACALAVRSAQHRLLTLQETPPPKIATYDATNAATYAATYDATSDAIPQLVRFLVRSCAYVYRGRNAGNMWSGWVAYLSFFRRVAKLDIDYSKFEHYEKATIHGGPRYMFEDFCIISDRPELIRKDETNGPHCADGPSHRWRDGWELYFWRGTRVPKAWIMDKANVSAASVLSWPNIERRRAGCEILGWDKVLGSLPHRVIDKDPEAQIGTLLEIDLPDSPGERFVQVLCGTGRTFMIPVEKSAKTALEAVASTYGLSAKDYKLEVRT